MKIEHREGRMILMIEPFVYAYEELQVYDTIEENKSIGLERQRAFKKHEMAHMLVFYILK
jgi:hypothetical protein